MWYSDKKKGKIFSFDFFLSYLVIYRLNLTNIIFNIDGSLRCWQDLVVAGVHFHSNIIPWHDVLPGILRAASRSRPSGGRSGPPLRVQVIIQQEWSRTVACREQSVSQLREMSAVPGMGVFSSQKSLSFPAGNPYLSLVVFPLASTKILIFP